MAYATKNLLIFLTLAALKTNNNALKIVYIPRRMGKRLVNIASAHCDFILGPPRLAVLLEEEEPDHIVVEVDTDRAKKIIARQNESRREQEFQELIAQYPHANPQTVSTYLRTAGFELIVALDYKYRHPKAEIHYGDINYWQAVKTQEESERRKGSLLSYPIEYLSDIAQAMYDAEPMRRDDFLEEDRFRDLGMSHVVLGLGGKVVTVNGIGHIYGDYYNLYRMLETLRPKRRMLPEADIVLEREPFAFLAMGRHTVDF
jgi:hypothetical protein